MNIRDKIIEIKKEVIIDICPKSININAWTNKFSNNIEFPFYTSMIDRILITEEIVSSDIEFIKNNKYMFSSMLQKIKKQFEIEVLEVASSFSYSQKRRVSALAVKLFSLSIQPYIEKFNKIIS